MSQHLSNAMPITILDLLSNKIPISRYIKESPILAKSLNLYSHNKNPEVIAMLDETWLPPDYTIEQLLEMPSDSIGHKLSIHLLTMNRNQEGIHSVPGTARFPIRYPISVEKLVGNRLRQTHDYMHLLTNFNTSQLGEAALQAFYLGQRSTILSLLYTISSLGSFITKAGQVDLLEAIINGLDMGLNAKPNSSFTRFELCITDNLDSIRRSLNIIPTSGTAWTFSEVV